MVRRVNRPAAWASLWCAGAILGLVLAGAVHAEAREAGQTRQYGFSSAPFWMVGDPDPELSRLCRRGRFNQRANNSYYIGYMGQANPGRGYTGIAKRGYNLRDPEARAADGFTYHFFNDGYSNCKVYVAPDPPPQIGGE